MTFLVPTKRWEIRSWEILATRARPPCPWRPRSRWFSGPLSRGGDLRWLTVYITWRKYR